MAIEVVGKDDSKTFKVTCRHCSSILRYLPVDVKSREHTDYSGSTDTYHYIDCPECKARVDVRNY